MTVNYTRLTLARRKESAEVAIELARIVLRRIEDERVVTERDGVDIEWIRETLVFAQEQIMLATHGHGERVR